MPLIHLQNGQTREICPKGFLLYCEARKYASVTDGNELWIVQIPNWSEADSQWHTVLIAPFRSLVIAHFMYERFQVRAKNHWHLGSCPAIGPDFYSLAAAVAYVEMAT